MNSFRDWIIEDFENPRISGQWGPLHIAVLLLSIVACVAIALLFRNKSERTRKIVLYVLAGIICAFEVSRRIINMYKMEVYTVNDVLYTLLPRPWCAISCWSLMAAAVFKKKWLSNYASIFSLLCAIIFFAYPSAGFNNKYIAYSNFYSIGTHAMLLVTSISLITLKFTEFKYSIMKNTIISLIVVFMYAFLEIYVLKIATDPLYFMEGNDVQVILGFEYNMYLLVYILFLIVYMNIFYLIDDRKKVLSLLHSTGKEEKETINNKF